MPSNSCTVKPVNDLKSSGFLDNRSYESKEGTNQYATMDHKAVFKLIMQEGPVNLSVYYIVVHFCKQIKPVFDMVRAAPRCPAWKVVIKALGPVLDVLHRPFYDA